jgi:hypothetical protein
MGADDDDVAVDVDVAVAAVVAAVNIIKRTITFITLSCPNVLQAIWMGCLGIEYQLLSYHLNP